MSVELERRLQEPGRPLVSPAQVRLLTEQLDLIARLVAHLPEQPATRQQAERLRIISIELARRAGMLR